MSLGGTVSGWFTHGIFAVRDHSRVPINERTVLAGAVAEVAGGNLGGYIRWEGGDEFSKGDFQSYVLWRASTRPTSSVSPAFSAITQSAGTGTTPAAYAPLRAPGSPDDRYETLSASLGNPPPNFGGFPAGTTGHISSGMEETRLEPIFHPDWQNAIIAVNRAGTPTLGTRVYDLTPGNALDPNRNRELQSLIAVTDLTPGSPACGLSGLALGIQFGKGGNLDGGVGKALLIDYDRNEYMSLNSGVGGPITGGQVCQHGGQLGTDADGKAGFPAHLDVNALRIGNGGDAPQLFERGTWSEPDGDFGLWRRVHQYFNPVGVHRIGCVQGNGYWQWEVRTPSAIILPPWIPDPPPPPEIPDPPPVGDPPPVPPEEEEIEEVERRRRVVTGGGGGGREVEEDATEEVALGPQIPADLSGLDPALAARLRAGAEDALGIDDDAEDASEVPPELRSGVLGDQLPREPEEQDGTIPEFISVGDQLPREPFETGDPRAPSDLALDGPRQESSEEDAEDAGPQAGTVGGAQPTVADATAGAFGPLYEYHPSCNYAPQWGWLAVPSDFSAIQVGGSDPEFWDQWKRSLPLTGTVTGFGFGSGKADGYVTKQTPTGVQVVSGGGVQHPVSVDWGQLVAGYFDPCRANNTSDVTTSQIHPGGLSSILCGHPMVGSPSGVKGGGQLRQDPGGDGIGLVAIDGDGAFDTGHQLYVGTTGTTITGGLTVDGVPFSGGGSGSGNLTIGGNGEDGAVTYSSDTGSGATINATSLTISSGGYAIYPTQNKSLTLKWRGAFAANDADFNLEGRGYQEPA